MIILIDLNGWINKLLLLTYLAWLNFAGNLWTDEGTRVILTSPAPATPRHRVDPWSRNAIPEEQKHFSDIIYAISHHQLDGSRTRCARPGSITPVTRNSILTWSTCSWWPITMVSTRRASVMASSRRVLDTRITGSSESTITLQLLPQALTGGQRQTITPEEPMKWETQNWKKDLTYFSMFRSSWCLPRHSVRPTQSTAVVTAVAGLKNRNRKQYPQTCRRHSREPGSCPRNVPRQLCQNRSSKNNPLPEPTLFGSQAASDTNPAEPECSPRAKSQHINNIIRHSYPSSDAKRAFEWYPAAVEGIQ